MCQCLGQHTHANSKLSRTATGHSHNKYGNSIPEQTAVQLAHGAHKYTQGRAGCWLTLHKAAPLPSVRRLLVFAARLNAAAMGGSAACTHNHRQAQAAVGLAGTGQQSVQQSPRRYYRQHCSSLSRQHFHDVHEHLLIWSIANTTCMNYVILTDQLTKSIQDLDHS